MLNKLIDLIKSVKESDRKVCNALLLQFCDSLRVGADRYYDKRIKELEDKKQDLYDEGKGLGHIDRKLNIVYEQRQKLAQKILQVPSRIPEMSKDDLIIPNYLFIPADSSNSNIVNILIFPKMNLSLESYKEKKE